jgi:malonyl-CoA/methylmalonyl-CoA synthetase
MHDQPRNHLFDIIRSRMPDGARTLMRLPGGGQISYAQTEQASRRYANALRSLGVTPGDRVVVQTEKSPSVVYLYLACLRIGAIFVPLNTAYTPAEIDYFLGDAEPALLVCDAGRLPDLEPLARTHKVRSVATLNADGGGTLADVAATASESFENVARSPDDVATILYTSGTTGRSKGAMLTHGNLASNALTLAEYWHFNRDDVLIHALPVFHAHGLFVALNVTLMAGSAMIFLPRFDPGEILASMPEATVLMGVPTYYTRLLQSEKLDRAAVAHMRLFISGSAPLLEETHRTWRERTGHAILERYGMTETSMNTSNPYDGERVPGTVGFPLPGIEIRITGPSGDVLPRGEIGMIEIKGPNVFKGYWRKPEQTASEFRTGGFFVSGDLGMIDERGYVRIVGRGKDLVISGGYNVYPKEVETEIDAIAGVVESAVFGVPHPDFGEGVTAAVVKRPDAPIREQDILRRLEQRLAKYKLPKRVMFVDELPRNTMGKVQKAALRKSYEALYAEGGREVESRLMPSR